MAKRENKFQKELIDEIKARFPGALVLKNDSSYIQGIPDLTVLYQDKWAMLEVKREKSASHQPNQDYYVGLADGVSFGRFVSPETKETVLDEMEHAFRSCG